MLPIGTTVKGDTTHASYARWGWQFTAESIGKVISGGGSNPEWSNVKWDNGDMYTYPDNSLIIVEEADGWSDVQRLKTDPVAIKKRRDEEDEMYALPLLPGMRVCLNPASSTFLNESASVRGAAGYVLSIDLEYNTLCHWSNLPNKRNIHVLVQWDTNEINKYKHKDLLQVDSKQKTVTQYTLHGIGVKSVLEGNASLEEYIENRIIKRGIKVKEMTVMDNEWRSEIIQSIISNHIVESASEVITNS